MSSIYQAPVTSTEYPVCECDCDPSDQICTCEKFYIAVDFFGWAQADTIENAFYKKADDSRTDCYTTIYEIIGDPKMLYSIRWFLPQIIGAKAVMVYDENENGEYAKNFHVRGTVQMGDKGQLEIA